MTKVYENYVNGIKMLEKRTELIPTAFGGKEEKEVGQYLLWHENGQKKSEENYKNGKEEGLYTAWYENGQKRCEINYKMGKLISSIEWDEEGNEIDRMHYMGVIKKS